MYSYSSTEYQKLLTPKYLVAEFVGLVLFFSALFVKLL